MSATRVVRRGFDVEVAERIEAFPAADWDALATGPDDLQATHAFARAVQDARVEDAAFRFVLLREAGRPVAAAAFSRMSVRLELLSPNGLRGVVGRARQACPGLLRVPVLLGGLPVSFGQSALRIAPGTDAAAVVATLARVADDLADRLDAPLVCFKEFTDAEAGAADALGGHGYVRLPSLPGCALALRWPSFDAYLGAMRAPYRRQLRADLDARAAGGLTVRRVTAGADVSTLFRLYESVMDRAPYQLERLNRPFFEALGPALGARALVLEHDGRAVAAAVLLVGPREATFLLAGLDYDTPPALRVYPNLVAEVVREAVASGARRLELGQTSYPLKTRLGGRPSARWLYLRARRPWAHRLLRAAGPALFPAVDVPRRRVFRADAP